MKVFKLLGLVFSMFLASTISAQKNKKDPKSETQVILMAGQSNMAGAGNYDELDDAIKKRIEKISNRVSLVFNGKVASPLSYYKNKPSKKYTFTKRFGPELLLGLTLAEKNPTKKYVIIKRSQGGTALYGAWNPNWTEEKAKAVEAKKKHNLKLFSMHLDDINTNLERLKTEGETYKITGFIWMQGENDATLKEAANNYAENLETLITKYRTIYNEKDLPFIFGQINSRYGIKNGAKMVREQMEIASNKIEKSSLIKTSTDKSWSDFPKHTDNVHYNTEGQKRLGIAFAKELMKLIK
jgi:hypothetical protein